MSKGLESESVVLGLRSRKFQDCDTFLGVYDI